MEKASEQTLRDEERCGLLGNHPYEERCGLLGQRNPGVGDSTLSRCDHRGRRLGRSRYLGWRRLRRLRYLGRSSSNCGNFAPKHHLTTLSICRSFRQLLRSSLPGSQLWCHAAARFVPGSVTSMRGGWHASRVCNRCRMASSGLAMTGSASGPQVTSERLVLAQPISLNAFRCTVLQRSQSLKRPRMMSFGNEKIIFRIANVQLFFPSLLFQEF